MEVTYTFNKDDFLRMSRFVWRRALGSQIWTYRICGAISFVIGAFGFGFYCSPLFSSHRSGVPITTFHLSGAAFMFMLAASGAAMMWTYSGTRFRREVARYVTRNGEIFCEHTVHIHPEWFQETIAVADTKVAWRMITDVVADDEYLYFFRSPSTAHTIPKRAFPTPSIAEEFLATAKAYWKGQPAPATEAGGAAWPPPPRA